MFSLDKGRPIAKIVGGDYDGEIIHLKKEEDNDNCSCCKKCSYKCENKPCCRKCKKYYDDSSDEEDDLGKSVVLTNGKLMPLPNIETREIPLIAGPSGSGKSTIAGNYSAAFKQIFPDKDFFVFSRKPSDPALDYLHPHRVLIDESLLENPIDITQELSDGALLLFDDVNTIQDDKLKKYIDKLMSDVMEIGRSYGIYIIITNHLVIPNEKKFARTVLNEMHSLTFFPKSGSAQQITYALKTYFGLNKNQIQDLLELPSRWVMVYKNYPQFVMYDKGCFLL